jgi:4-amino-4-deoxy-L-arabinose transferase-like glycosyltransferase
MSSRKSRPKPKPSVSEAPAAPHFSLATFVEQHALIFAIALVLVASFRIALTYTVFNHTSDEPNHIACGMEWLQYGKYTFETQHPPLARVAAALGPYLIGARVKAGLKPDSMEVPLEGSQILYRGHRYDLTLALARLGILPFFWLACFVVYWWTRRQYGALTAVVALFLFSFVPPVLAHGGLATTDMPLTTFAGAAFFTGLYWLEEPNPRRAAVFGACCGLAAISKFSILAFLPAIFVCAALLYFAIERPDWRAFASGGKRALPTFALAVAVGALVIWAGFRFSFGRIVPGGIPVPAPELFRGIQSVAAHNKIGHHTYLFGKYSVAGFWYYYPVVLGVKTPLALLLLFAAGLWLGLRKPDRTANLWQPLGLIAGILAIGWYSRINIGVRHILPVYIGISMIAAVAAFRLPQLLPGRWGKIALAVLLLWFAGSSLLAHPDYLPYFNELAGSQPEKILVDSDLDWGQDLKRLARRLQELGVGHVAFRSTLVSEAKEQGLPPLTAQSPFAPSPGWNAVSLTYWKLLRMGLMSITFDGKLTNLYPDRTLWPDQVPRGELVGKSILLWNVGVNNQPGAEGTVVLH